MGSLPKSLWKTVAIVIAIALLGAFMYGNILKYSKREGAEKSIEALRCPEFYKTDLERVRAFADFAEYYVDVNPGVRGDVGAYLRGRLDFLIERNCVSTLMNLGYDGYTPIDSKVREKLLVSMKDIEKVNAGNTAH